MRYVSNDVFFTLACTPRRAPSSEGCSRPLTPPPGDPRPSKPAATTSKWPTWRPCQLRMNTITGASLCVIDRNLWTCSPLAREHCRRHNGDGGGGNRRGAGAERDNRIRIAELFLWCGYLNTWPLKDKLPVAKWVYLNCSWRWNCTRIRLGKWCGAHILTSPLWWVKTWAGTRVGSLDYVLDYVFFNVFDFRPFKSSFDFRTFLLRLLFDLQSFALRTSSVHFLSSTLNPLLLSSCLHHLSCLRIFT